MVLAGEGLAHGDLSAFNLLVHRDQLVLIDLPQVVDVVANPQGPQFLARDVATVTAWFAARGLPPEVADAAALEDLLRCEAGLPEVPGSRRPAPPSDRTSARPACDRG